MAAEFSIDIEVGYYTDNWGPYSFNFPIATAVDSNDGLIPYGATITAVTVSTYQGNVNRKSTLADETEITGLIDADHTPSISDGDTIAIRFAYPNVSFKGQKATIIFAVTLSTGAQKAFYAQYVRIR